MIHNIHQKGIQMKQLMITIYIFLFSGLTINAMERKSAIVPSLYNAHKKAMGTHFSPSLTSKPNNSLEHLMNKRLLELLATFHIKSDDDNSNKDTIENKLLYANAILEIGANPNLKLHSFEPDLKHFIQITPILHIFDYCYQTAKRTSSFLTTQETPFKPPSFISPRDLLEKWLYLLRRFGANLNILYKIPAKKGQKIYSLTLCDAMQNADYNWYLYFTRIFNLKSAQQIKKEEHKRKNKEFLRELYKYHP